MLERLFLAADVAIQRTGNHAEAASEGAHTEGLRAFRADDREGLEDDALAGERTAAGFRAIRRVEPQRARVRGRLARHACLHGAVIVNIVHFSMPTGRGPAWPQKEFLAIRACAGGPRGPRRRYIAADAYTMRCMPGLYEVEIEPEVRSWLASLSDRDFGRADFLVDCWPSAPKTLVSPIPAISAARFGSCDFICCASRPGLPTGSPRGGE